MSVSTRLSCITALLVLVLSSAAAQAQAAKCRPCALAQERCSVNCLGREGKAIGACLIGCDNAAALCSCDEPATLNSEDFVARFGPQPDARAQAGLRVVTEFSGACNSTTPCDSSYGACANWSGYSNCGDPFCGWAVGCGLCDEYGQCEPGGQAMNQFVERYRVCFNELGQSCTEYDRQQFSTDCGC